jgi:hypothetical protein
MKTYTFDRDALCALHSLLDLVHYDDLAQQFIDLLPIELRRDMYNVVWMEEEMDCQ